jgi:hypothetical protein
MGVATEANFKGENRSFGFVGNLAVFSHSSDKRD